MRLETRDKHISKEIPMLEDNNDEITKIPFTKELVAMLRNSQLTTQTSPIKAAKEWQRSIRQMAQSYMA